MHTITLLLYVAAAVSFTLAAMNIGAHRVNMVALGLLAWVLVDVVRTA